MKKSKNEKNLEERIKRLKGQVDKLIDNSQKMAKLMFQCSIINSILIKKEIVNGDEINEALSKLPGYREMVKQGSEVEPKPQ